MSGFTNPEPSNEEIFWLKRYPRRSDSTDAYLTYDRMTKRFTAHNGTITERSVTVRTEHGTYMVTRDSHGR